MNEMANHLAESALASALMRRVAIAIEQRGLSPKEAADAAKVTLATLQKHLAGEHVRSDSARKYENWLGGRQTAENVFVLAPRAAEKIETSAEAALPSAPSAPHLVVDIFSGCGGLSLGFDLLNHGEYFKTILAIDNQAAPISVLNRNAEVLGHDGPPIGRRVDLTDFMNASEVLAFYLQHVASVRRDGTLAARLQSLAGDSFRRFLSAVAASDIAYISELTEGRSTQSWRAVCDALDKQSLSQTSVIGFHEKLRLPRTSTKPPTLPPMLWTDIGTLGLASAPNPSTKMLRRAEEEWHAEVEGLSSKRGASGRGQLSASSRRVSAFVDLLNSNAMQQVRAAWIKWRARRLQLRSDLFGDPEFSAGLRNLYAESYPVTVLVGGPPCQGFSRIGRGKIRSLREAQVHVHGHSEAGDARNLLFQQYVMVLGALRPKVFLFENVQHFESTVKAAGVEFQATEVLAEAIASVSDGEVSYNVSSRILDASRHGVPQSRQRYFMCGIVRKPGFELDELGPDHCLSLPRAPEVSLAHALSGLPPPEFVGGDTAARGEFSGHFAIEPGSSILNRYSRWIRRSPPGRRVEKSDGHFARAPRADDAAFFGLMGPGKRWMDYRADDAPTLEALSGVLATLTGLPKVAYKALQKAAAASGDALPALEQLDELRRRVDGSLPIRLLLEQVGHKLGAPHHLLAETYLMKRDGNHGDWVARMDATRPSKTMVSHMGKDTYSYIHPTEARTISVREAARIQSFPDWYSFGDAALTDAFKMIGNAVPPLLSNTIAARVAQVLAQRTQSDMDASSTTHSLRRTPSG